MNRRNIFNLSATTVVGLALLSTSAFAQQKTIKEQIVGTWVLVSAVNTAKDGAKINPWGPNPKGSYMFDSSGHFSQMLMRSDLPKTASRDKGAPETDRAIVAGSFSAYGTYTVDEATKTVNIRYEGSSFAAFNGTDGKRIINPVSSDEIKVSNPATSDGTTSETTWRRVK